MLEAGASSTFFFTVKIDLVFERNTSCNLGVSRGRNAVFAPNRPIQVS
jgi:hypothetical protein